MYIYICTFFLLWKQVGICDTQFCSPLFFDPKTWCVLPTKFGAWNLSQLEDYHLHFSDSKVERQSITLHETKSEFTPENHWLVQICEPRPFGAILAYFQELSHVGFREMIIQETHV